MKYGLVLGTMGPFADTNLVMELAKLADDKWDGIFLADHLMHSRRMKWLDPYIMLSGIASVTNNVKLGTWITAVPRRLPWQLAKEIATLDHLSNGRMSIGVGLGAPADDFESFGIKYNLKKLAEKLDESLEIMDLIWKGELFDFEGVHYQLSEVKLTPKPVQSPRVPIFVGGYQPGGKKTISRAVKWDGIMPISKNFPRNFSIDELETTINDYKEVGGNGEILITGETYGSEDGEFHDRAKELGVTWLFKQIYPKVGPFEEFMKTVDEFKEFIQEGPEFKN